MTLRTPFALALCASLAGCDGCRSTTSRDASVGAAPRPSDGGTIVRVTEAAPLGPSPDRREVDVPIAWIHLLSEPAPTGSTPYAIVGARMPCGYGPNYGTSERVNGEVRLRLRAQWLGAGPVPETIPPCGDRPVRSFLVSQGILRLGTWRVVDMVPHGPNDDPPPVARVQHVLPDDANLPAPALRWMRGCATDDDCTAGGVCASVEGARLCLAAVDPWLSEHGNCPEGTSPADAQHTPDAGAATWRACVATCQHNTCPAGLVCNAQGHCLPPPR